MFAAGPAGLTVGAASRHAWQEAVLLGGLILAGLGFFAGQESFAQALIANGTTQTASGTYSTTASGTAGYGWSVLNVGVVNTSGAVTITTAGTSANGINATTGGTVNLTNDTSVTTSGSSAIGINLNNASLIATAPLTVSANNPTSSGSTGIAMQNGSTASVTGGGSITSIAAPALTAAGVGTQFTGQNLSFVSHGGFAGTIGISTGASVTLTGGSVAGDAGSNTINVSGAASSVSLNNMSVTTFNTPPVNGTAGTPAGVAVDAGTGRLNNVTITTFPDSGEAVAALNGGTITISNSTLTTNGGNVLVGQAGAGATGARAVGVNSTTNTPSSITLTNTTITTNGPGSAGVESADGGVITMTRGSITSNNPLAEGIVTTATTAATATSPVSRVTMTDVTIASAGDAIVSLGGTSVISLTGSTVTTGSGLALNVQANPNGGTPIAANTTLLASSSTITGAMVTDSISTSTVELSNATHWTMTGNSNLTNLTNSASTIEFTAPTGDPTLLSSYKTLTVNNYVGANGTLGLNTFLGTDGSPSDRLVINGGTATGSSFVHITNAGGPGAETTGNGILAVNAINGGTTAAGAFTLLGEVRGGAFDYFLFRGGLSGSDPNDWFLRSSFRVEPVPPGPVPPGPVPPLPPGVPEVFPTDPPPAPLPPGLYPIIGPELATYGVVQPIARQLGLTTLGTLHERAGDTLEGSCSGAAAASAVAPAATVPARAAAAPDGACKPGLWGRVFGESINNRYSAFADPRATGQIAGIQTGFDFFRGSLIPGHSDTAGLYLAYGNAHVDVDGLVTNTAATAYVLSRTGTVGLNAYSGGAYWTHYGPSGWYFDLVVQGTGYDGSATTQFANLPITGSGFVSSLETGYPIPLPWFGTHFVLEPQGQIIWQQVAFKETNDGLGPVGLGTTSGATGRLGLRGQWTITGANGMVWQPYVRANVWRDWGAEATTNFGIDQVPLIEQATRLEFAGGVTAKLGSSLSLFAQGGYQFATGEPGNGIRRDSVKGDIGVRYAW